MVVKIRSSGAELDQCCSDGRDSTAFPVGPAAADRSNSFSLNASDAKEQP